MKAGRHFSLKSGKRKLSMFECKKIKGRKMKQGRKEDIQREKIKRKKKYVYQQYVFLYHGP